jgi:hypothetical protein
MIFNHRFKKIAELLLIIGTTISLFISVLVLNSEAAQKKRFIVSDQFVKDNKTGLVWSRDANPAGQLLSWDSAADYIRILNAKHYEGHADWRMPEIDELVKLWDAAKEDGAADVMAGDTAATLLTRLGFQNVQDGEYWSSSENVYNESEAWYMSAKQGVKSSGNKSLYLSVWPVRFEKK